jgi:hypothetical protein
MARVTTEERPGFRTCSDMRCPGYESTETPIVVETVAFTFRDNGSDGAPGIDHDSVERATVTVKPAGFEDHNAWLCPTCGAWSNFSVAPRPVYEQVSGQPQDELLRVTGKVADNMAKDLERAKAQAEERAEDAVLRAEALAEQRRANDLKERELALLESRASTESDVPAESTPARGSARPKAERAAS